MSIPTIKKLQSDIELFEVKYKDGFTELRRRFYIEDDDEGYPTTRFDCEKELAPNLKICIEALEKIVKKQATFQDPNCKCKFCVGFSIAQSALKKVKE